MGIKKMNSFLSEHKIYKKYAYISDVIKDNNIGNKDIIIGVDANLFCYKYSHSCDNMLIGFYNQILNFLSHGYIPLYIFDGGNFEEKENTLISRNKRKNNLKLKIDMIDECIIDSIENMDEDAFQELLQHKKRMEKNTIKISKEDINKIVELFDLLSIPYIFAQNEAEYLAVLLNEYDIINLFLSDDTDPIASGIKHLIKFNNNMVVYYNFYTCCKELNIDKNQLCDMSILFGNDYIKFKHNLKPCEIYELIHNNYCIENIVDKIYKVGEDDEGDEGDEIDKVDKVDKVDKIYKVDDYSSKVIWNCNDTVIAIINKIRNIYKKSPNNEKEYIFVKNCIIDSNVLVEYWDEFVDILKDNSSNIVSNKVITFKSKIYNFIKNHKLNINNVIKFFKQNVCDITISEIDIMISSLLTCYSSYF